MVFRESLQKMMRSAVRVRSAAAAASDQQPLAEDACPADDAKLTPGAASDDLHQVEAAAEDLADAIAVLLRRYDGYTTTSANDSLIGEILVRLRVLAGSPNASLRLQLHFATALRLVHSCICESLQEGLPHGHELYPGTEASLLSELRSVAALAAADVRLGAGEEGCAHADLRSECARCTYTDAICVRDFFAGALVDSHAVALDCDDDHLADDLLTELLRFEEHEVTPGAEDACLEALLAAILDRARSGRPVPEKLMAALRYRVYPADDGYGLMMYGLALIAGVPDAELRKLGIEELGSLLEAGLRDIRSVRANADFIVRARSTDHRSTFP